MKHLLIPCIFWSFAILVIFPSCDKVENPYPLRNSPQDTGVVDTNIVWDDSVFSKPNNNARFVLIEEFTGHVCSNCPEGADEIKLILNQKEDSVIAIAMHVTSTFAAPKNLTIDGKLAYSHDHRTKAGTEYENIFEFGISLGLPGAMVSRYRKQMTSTTLKLNRTEWKAQVNKILHAADPVVANIDIKNLFDDSSKTFQVHVAISWLVKVTGNLNLQVQMVEDHITDWQKDNRKSPEDVENYDHRHMFRGTVNGSFGESIPASSIAVGTKSEFTYNRKFDPEGKGFKLKDFTIVAFIYKAAPDYEVLQVNEAHLVK